LEHTFLACPARIDLNSTQAESTKPVLLKDRVDLRVVALGGLVERGTEDVVDLRMLRVDSDRVAANMEVCRLAKGDFLTTARAVRLCFFAEAERWRVRELVVSSSVLSGQREGSEERESHDRQLKWKSS